MANFVTTVRDLAPGARWMTGESLHLTLKFVGERSVELVEQLKSQLTRVEAGSFPISFHGCGFFPNPNSARVFWIGIDPQPALAELAAKIDDSIAAMGIPKEDRAFHPHLTLAREGSGSPMRQKDDKTNLRFAGLQKRLSELPSPDFGTMAAREFFLYKSRLSREGPRYTKIARFPLNP